MGWTIILENEDKTVVSSLSEELIITFEDFSKFRLLCYLDAYGDTIFNRLQMDDLIYDLQILNEMEANPAIDKIKLLAENCKREVHTYLCFYGD